MAAEVLGRAVVHKVRTVLQRALEVRAHHGIVNHDDRVGCALLHIFGDGSNINDLQQRVGGRLQEYHGRLSLLDVRVQAFRICSVDVVHNHAEVVFEVGQKSVGSAVEIIARNNLITWLEETRDDV